MAPQNDNRLPPAAPAIGDRFIGLCAWAFIATGLACAAYLPFQVYATLCRYGMACS